MKSGATREEGLTDSSRVVQKILAINIKRSSSTLFLLPTECWLSIRKLKHRRRVTSDLSARPLRRSTRPKLSTSQRTTCKSFYFHFSRCVAPGGGAFRHEVCRTVHCEDSECSGRDQDDVLLHGRCGNCMWRSRGQGAPQPLGGPSPAFRTVIRNAVFQNQLLHVCDRGSLRAEVPERGRQLDARFGTQHIRHDTPPWPCQPQTSEWEDYLRQAEIWGWESGRIWLEWTLFSEFQMAPR